MPVTLCRAINSDIASFWWGKKEDSDKIHWQSWTKLCRAKELGGLGFRDLESFNLALLAKQSWRIQNNPNSLWVRILKARYFNNCSFFHAKAGPRSSWAWSSILAGRSSIMTGVRWQVNNGNKIQVWEDSWLPNGSDGLLHPFPTSNRFTPLLVHDLIDQDTMSWKIDHIEPFIPPEEAAAIKEIRIGDPSTDDRMIWPLERSGTFTVKSGYHFIHKSVSTTPTTSSSHMVNKKVWKLIWNISTLPKVRHFLWRAITNSLPVGCSLYRRKVVKSPMCSICGQYEESSEHCLLFCPWTDCVWFGSSMGLRIPKHEITTLDEWILHLASVDTPLGTSRQQILSLFASFAWCIWKTRCNSVYKGLHPSPIQTIHTANILLHDFQVSMGHHKRVSPPQVRAPQAIWIPPIYPHTKLNVDGAWNHNTNQGSTGAIIRDCLGLFVAGAAKSIVAHSPIEAEAAALIEGMKLVINLNLDNIIVESDSKELILALDNHIEKGNWRIYPFLIEFHRLRNLLCNVSWHWISREANRAADAAAKLAKSRLYNVSWVDMPPTSLVSVLANDGLPCPH